MRKPIRTTYDPDQKAHVDWARSLLEMNGTLIFRVTFKKRGDGQTRHMVCRLRVKPDPDRINVGPRAYDPADHDLLTVYDVQARGYRNVDLRTVSEIAMMGTVINLVR